MRYLTVLTGWADVGPVIGPVSKDLDATGLLLDMAERETAIALGHAAIDRGEIA